MPDDRFYLGITQLGEGRHDPPGATQPDGLAQKVVIHTRQKRRQ